MKKELLTYKLLAVHSQSTRPDSPYNFGIPEEQAYDSRALTLPNTGGVLLSTSVESAYNDYLINVLHVGVSHTIVPTVKETSLTKRLLKDTNTRRKIKDRQEEIGLPFSLSVFDVTDDEKRLLEQLDKELAIFPEVNFDQAVILGNKSGFRKFCAENAIPQFEGGVFQTVDALKAFIDQHPLSVVKHPVGTAGDGLKFITPHHPATEADFDTWKLWMEHGEIVAEVFNPGGDEYALHVYIDPVTKKGKISGIYQQLVKKTDDDSLAHYGVIYPPQDSTAVQALKILGEQQIIPALKTAGYTGPAAIDMIMDDTLPQPLHTMELNARAGANMYLHRMVEQVGESLYAGSDIPFMSLVSLPLPMNFAELSTRFAEVLKPKENGTLIFTNPGRHEFGFYDITAISPYGIEEAQKILFEGISEIWGYEKAQEFFTKIHKRS